MAEAAASPKAGKLDSLPKEELIKYIRKQAAQMRDVKKKNEDLSAMVNHEKQEVERLEQEKKSWLSRGVSAEFEKKEKIIEKELERATEEKEMLEGTLKAVQSEYKLAKEEAQKCSKALELTLEEQERENEKREREKTKLLEQIQGLEDMLDKERGGKGEMGLLKEEYAKLRRENDDLDRLNMDLQAKVNAFPNTEAEEVMRLNRENKEFQLSLEANKAEIENLQKQCDAVKVKLEESDTKCKQLDEELLKTKADREKAVKSIKILKTKTERGSQIEEELRRQLNIICSERDDFQGKVATLQKEKKNLVQNIKKLKEKLRNNKESGVDDDPEKGRDSPKGLEYDLNVENAHLKESVERLEQNKQELHEQYETVKAEIANIEGERSEMEHLLKNYEAEMMKINEKYETLKKEYDALKFENDENHTAKVTFEEEKDHLTSQNESLRKDIHNILDEKEVIITRYSALEEELQDLKKRVPLDAGVVQVCSSEMASNEEIEEVKSEVLRLEQTLMNVKEQNAKSDLEVSNLRDVIKEKTEEITRLSDDKTQLETQRLSLEKQLEEIKKAPPCPKCDSLENLPPTENAKQAEENEADKVTEREEELTFAKTTCEKLRQNLQDTEEKYLSLQNEVQEISTNAQEDAANAIQDKEILLEELNKVNEERDSLRQMLDELKKQNDVLSSKQQEHKGNVTRLQGRVDELLSRLQNLNEEKMHQESEIEELFKAQDELHNKFDAECREKKEKETIIKDLEEQLRASELEKEKISHDKKDMFARLQDLLKNQENYQSDLQSQMNKMRMENETLRQENQALRESITNLREEIKGYRYQNSGLQSNLTKRNEIVDETEHLNISGDCTAKKGDFIGNSMPVIPEEDLVDHSLHKLQEQIETGSCDKNEIELLTKEHEKQVISLTDNVDQLTKEVSMLKQTNASLEDQLLQTKHEYEMQHKQNNDVVNNLEEYNTELEAKLKALIKDCQDLRDLVEDMKVYKDHFDRLQSEYDIILKEREECQLNIQDLSEQNSHLKKMCSDVEEQIVFLNNELRSQSHLAEERDRLQSQVRELSDNCSSSLEEISCLKAEMQKLSTENETLNVAKASLEAVVDKTSSDVNSLNASVKEAETLKEQICGLTEELEKKDLSMDHLHNEIRSLCCDVESYKNQVSDLEENLSKSQQEFSKKEEELLKTQKAFSKLKHAFQSLKDKTKFAEEEKEKENSVRQEEKRVLVTDLQEKESAILKLEQVEKELLLNLENQRKETEEIKKHFECQLQEVEIKSKEDVTRKESEISELKCLLDASGGTLETTIKENRLQVEVLSAENLKLASVNEELSNELKGLQCSLDLLRSEKDVTLQNLEEASQKLSYYQLQSENLATTLGKHQEELDVLHGVIQEKTARLEESNLEREKMSQTSQKETHKDDLIEKLKQENSEQCSHVNLLKEEIADLQERFDAACAKVITAEQLSQEYLERVTELENSRKDMTTMLQSKDDEVNDSKVLIGRLEDELQEAFNRLEEVELSLKDKEEKANKFKAVAMRAKKELDNVRSQVDPEKERLQAANDQLQTIAQQFEAELLRQREECQKHEEDYEGLQKEADTARESLDAELARSKELIEEIEALHSQVEKLTVSLAASENECTKLQENYVEEKRKCEALSNQINEVNLTYEETMKSLRKEQEEHKNVKERLKTIEEELGSAQKESQHVAVMNLEIHDYQRTIESLQKKIADREERIRDCEKQMTVLDGTIVSLKEDLAAAERLRQESEEKGNKLKAVLVKTKKDLNDTKLMEAELQKAEIKLRQEVESLNQLLEDYKLQTSDLLGEKESLLNQIKSNADMNQRSHQALELKLTRLQNDLSASQQAHAVCRQEFESYKIRAQTVLKQQKARPAEPEDSLSKEEKDHFESVIEQLKTKVKESNDHVHVLMHDHEDLEEEHEKLLSRHNELIFELKDVESKWKTRFEQAQKDSNERILDYEEKFKELAAQKESITSLYKQQREKFEKAEKDHRNEMITLKQQLEEVKSPSKSAADHDSPKDNAEAKKEQREAFKIKTAERLRLSFDSSASNDIKFVERQEGEGMEQSQLEVADQGTGQTPTSQSSFESANLLERLLSPADISPEADWINSPIESMEEGVKLKSNLSIAQRKVEHLTELLRESEATSLRLGDQAKILKDEIRRLEKNQEREEALHNLEYLKNVTIKFLKCAPSEREYLVPVLSTMLKLTQDETEYIKEFAKGEQEAADANAASWSSYVYRWSTFS